MEANWGWTCIHNVLWRHKRGKSKRWSVLLVYFHFAQTSTSLMKMWKTLYWFHDKDLLLLFYVGVLSRSCKWNSIENVTEWEDTKLCDCEHIGFPQFNQVNMEVNCENCTQLKKKRIFLNHGINHSIFLVYISIGEIYKAYLFYFFELKVNLKLIRKSKVF